MRQLDPRVMKALVAIVGTIASAFLGAFSLFLSRVLEPLIAWFAFTSMKLLIKLTGSDTLRSLYGDLKKGYKESKDPYGGGYGGGNYPPGPPGGPPYGY